MNSVWRYGGVGYRPPYLHTYTLPNLHTFVSKGGRGESNPCLLGHSQTHYPLCYSHRIAWRRLESNQHQAICKNASLTLRICVPLFVLVLPYTHTSTLPYSFLRGHEESNPVLAVLETTAVPSGSTPTFLFAFRIKNGPTWKLSRSGRLSNPIGTDSGHVIRSGALLAR